MKRYIKQIATVVLTTLLVVFLMCGLTGCDFLNGIFNSPENNPNVRLISNSSFIEKNSAYNVVDSFALDNGLCYYIFELGTVDYVPMNISGADGVQFNGTETDLTFHYSETEITESSTYIENTVENSIQLKTTSFSKASVEKTLIPTLKAGLNVGVENSVSYGITHTFTESFYDSVSTEKTFEKALHYKMSKNDPKGYYFYTPIASMKIYEVVVYEPNAKKIEYMFSYSQFSQALPGLYYSPTGFIDYESFDITFDESKLPEFEAPSKTVKTDIKVMVDSDGADCDATEIDCKFGEAYGALPTLSKKGYKFLNWSCDGRAVDENAMVLSTKPIVAQWELVTSATVKIPSEISVDAGDKLNPFGLVFEGWTNEEEINGLNLNDWFDIATLKAEGYKLRIIYEYDVLSQKFAGFIPTGVSAEYDLYMRIGKNNFFKMHGQVKNSNYEHKRNVTSYTPIEHITDDLMFEISTANLAGVKFRNIHITFEFTK